MTNRKNRLKGPHVALSFLLFCVLCGVIVNNVLKSRLSIISVPGFRKRQKQRTNLARRSSPENYYSSGRNAPVNREFKIRSLRTTSGRENRSHAWTGLTTLKGWKIGVLFDVKIVTTTTDYGCTWKKKCPSKMLETPF